MLLVGLAWLALVPVAPAVTYTWTGAGFFGQDYLWSNDFNWAGGVAPSPGEANVTLVFPNNASPKVTTNDIAGLSVASIQFQGANYVVHGKPAGNTLGLSGAGWFGWSITASASGSYFAGTCPLVFSGSGFVNAATNCTLSVLSTVSGPGGFTKTGSGTVKFAAAAANTYAGTTTVNEGTLDLNSGVLFPSVTSYVSVPGPLVIGGTNLDYAPVVRLLFDNQIANTAPITVNENGLLALNGHDDVLGPVTLSGGVIDTDVTSGPSAPGTWSLNSNVTNLPSASGVDARISGQLFLGALARTFRVETNSQLKIDAVISDSAIFDPGFIKTGGGRLVLSNAPNTHTGPTVVDEGALRLQGSNTLLGATSAGTVVNPNGVLELDNAQIGAEPLSLNGTPNKSVLQFLSNKWNRWAGPVTLNGDCGIVGWEETVFSHGLEISGAVIGSGKIRKAGDGNLKLAGGEANTFTGGIDVTMGWVVMEKLGNLPALSGPLVVGVTNAQVPTDSYVSISDGNQIPDHLPVTLHHTAQLYIQPGVVEVLGHLTLGGALVQNWGSLTLSGNVTNHAELTDSGYHSSSIHGNVNFTPGTHLINCDHTVPRLAFYGVVSGNAGITKLGPGTLELRNTNTYSGLTWIQEGDLSLWDDGRPGSSAAGTSMEVGTRLYLYGTSVTNEALALKGNYPDTLNVYSGPGTNRWRGPVTLEGEVEIRAYGHLILDGPITGPGGLHLRNATAGPNVIELAGNAANTYSGDTTIEAGTVLLNKSGALAIPGNLNLTGTNLLYGTNVPCIARLLQPNQIADAGAVTIGTAHSLVLAGNAETIGSLLGAGEVVLGSATLTTGGGASSTFDGLITGTGGLTKVGTHTFSLTGDNSYTGTTAINNGVLMVFGQQPGSPVTVANGAKLGGTGRVGNLSDLNGHVWPGASPGILVCGNYSTFTPANQLQIEIGGTAPGSFDQLQVHGSVLLMGGALQLHANLPGPFGQSYVIIDNDGGDPVTGTFTGLPEGSLLTNNAAVFQITYAGGTGNDVALTRVLAGPPPEITAIEKLGGGTIKVTGTGFPNATYTVQAATNLTPPAVWVVIGATTASGAGLMNYLDGDAGGYPMRFYRLTTP